jgi:hypothetical protein
MVVLFGFLDLSRRAAGEVRLVDLCIFDPIFVDNLFLGPQTLQVGRGEVQHHSTVLIWM